MPHDIEGTELKLHDIVTVRARVVSLQAQKDYCNCSVQIMDGPENMRNSITLNTQATRLVSREAVEPQQS